MKTRFSISKKRLHLSQSRDEVITPRFHSYRDISQIHNLIKCLPLGTRNMCNAYSATDQPTFAESTPGCTSQSFPLKLLSAGDSFSLTVPWTATLSVQCLCRIEYIICEKFCFVNENSLFLYNLV